MANKDRGYSILFAPTPHYQIRSIEGLDNLVEDRSKILALSLETLSRSTEANLRDLSEQGEDVEDVVLGRVESSVAFRASVEALKEKLKSHDFGSEEDGNPLAYDLKRYVFRWGGEALQIVKTAEGEYSYHHIISLPVQ
ncbi:MAG: hypothetical protein JSW08_01655 [archaeon]|nr:MAG: hypothetical protein JSW08_01655 [archaeon]